MGFMLLNIFADISDWIRSWSPALFAIVIMILVMFLAFATVAFVKKATSDKPAIKIGKIITIAILVLLIVYIISTH